MTGRIRNYAQDKAGFSFVELMVVIAMIGVLSAIAAPGVLRSLPEKRLKNAARNLYSDMQRARLQAVKENKKVRVRFETDSKGDFYYFDADLKETDPGYGKWNSGEFRQNLYEYGDVSYGFGKAKKKWNGDGINPDSKPANNTGFSSTGTADTGSVFLQNQKKDICYAVTTTNYGTITIRRFNGKDWDEKK
ncbi:MAG: GspH/FimT family pseudopilin [Candidatus Electronema sp. V4]|uniref:GspH/FimT family pseudopilin n=1 Tax=Candidatus Electronema sp. V4 TaxID=3454756 RepID=UPI0040553C37